MGWGGWGGEKMQTTVIEQQENNLNIVQNKRDGGVVNTGSLLTQPHQNYN